MLFRTFIISVFCIAASLSLAEKGKHKGACKEDIKTFCTDKGIKPGGGRIAACLKAQEANLSATCKEARSEIKEKVKGWHAACKGDIKQFCKGIRPGKGRILSCLKTKESELSSDCQTAMR